MQQESQTPTGDSPRERHPHEKSLLPPWVPTVIGIILVVMAGLAVYTGSRFRNPNVSNGVIKTRRPPRAMTGVGPPGEPEAGSSLVFPGAAADNTPAANGGVQVAAGTIPLIARRGMMVNVLPDDAMVFVNNLAIGEARQFNTMNKVYDFPAAGSYAVRIVAPGYKERLFVIRAAEDAEQEIVRLDAKLERAK